MHHLAALLASTLVVSGCSWALSRPPHHSAQPARAYQAALCRPSYAPPVIDTWQAAGGGLVTLLALSHASGSEADTFGVLAAVSAGVTAVWSASAAYGFEQARACRELRDELARSGPAPMWIAPSVPSAPPTAAPPIVVEPDAPIVIEQDVDVDGDQIEVRTRIRPGTP